MKLATKKVERQSSSRDGDAEQIWSRVDGGFSPVKIPDLWKSEPDFWGNRNRNGSPRAKLDVASTTGEGVADEFLIIR